jgi:hypothetical protein
MIPQELPLGFEVGRHRRGWLDPDDPGDALTIGWLKKMRKAGQAVEIKVLTNPVHKWLWRRRNVGYMYMGVTYVNARPADAGWLLERNDLGIIWAGPPVIREYIDYCRWEAAETERTRIWAAWRTSLRGELDETAWEQAWAALPRTSRPRPPVAAGVPMATLYRFWSVEGELLYIGQTIRGYERLKAHERKAWYPEAANVTLERVPAAQVLQMEAAAIRAERPRYNIVHRPPDF